MDGIWYLLAIIGIWAVAWWCWRNDRAAADQPTTGLLAMARPAKPAKPAKR